MVVAFQEEPKDYMQELVEDIVEIVTSFAARVYGKRSHKYEKLVKCVNEAVKNDLEDSCSCLAETDWEKAECP